MWTKAKCLQQMQKLEQEPKKLRVLKQKQCQERRGSRRRIVSTCKQHQQHKNRWMSEEESNRQQEQK